MTYLPEGYRDVDAAADLEKLKTCLTVIDRLPDFQTYKHASYEALNLTPRGKVADVACGLGFDLPRLREIVPQGSVTGFDLSNAFLSFAADHASEAMSGDVTSVAVRQSDIHDLDCEADVFDAARIDRSLQHVADPVRAIAEMTRIVRAGGIVCAAEPDWRSYVIGSDLPDVSEKITSEFAKTIRNPHLGRSLVDLLGAELALTHHSAHPLLLRLLPDAEIIFDVKNTVSRSVEAGFITKAEGDAFEKNLEERHASGRFFAHLTVHLVAGQKQ